GFPRRESSRDLRTTGGFGGGGGRQIGNQNHSTPAFAEGKAPIHFHAICEKPPADTRRISAQVRLGFYVTSLDRRNHHDRPAATLDVRRTRREIRSVEQEGAFRWRGPVPPQEATVRGPLAGLA